MSDRPTPETDDIARGNHVVPTEWAQQLERERDEAREELHDIRLNLGDDAEGYTLLHAVCVIQNERDEAREAFKEMWRSGDAFLPHVDSDTINRWRKAAGWEETK